MCGVTIRLPPCLQAARDRAGRGPDADRGPLDLQLLDAPHGARKRHCSLTMPGLESRAPPFHMTGAVALNRRRLVDLQNSSAADKWMVGEQLRRGVQVGGLDHGPAVERPLGKTVLRAMARDRPRSAHW